MGARWVMGAGGRGGGGSDSGGGGGGGRRRTAGGRRAGDDDHDRARRWRRRIGHERAAAHRHGHGRGHRVGHARHGRRAARRADAGGLRQGRARAGQPEGGPAARRPQVRRGQAGGHHDDERLRVPAVRQQRPDRSPATRPATRSAPRSATSTKAGTIIDAAAGVVGDQITLQGVSFTIDDTGSLRQAARDDAVANAKSQADQLAAATRAEGRQGGVDRRGRGPEHPPRVRRGGCSGHHGGRLDAGPAPARPAGAEPVRHGRLRAHVVSWSDRPDGVAAVGSTAHGQATHRHRLRDRQGRGRPGSAHRVPRGAGPGRNGPGGAGADEREGAGGHRRVQAPAASSRPRHRHRERHHLARVRRGPPPGRGLPGPEHAVGPPAGHRRGGRAARHRGRRGRGRRS